jgi:hypothetical protein
MRRHKGRKCRINDLPNMQFSSSLDDQPGRSPCGEVPDTSEGAVGSSARGYSLIAAVQLRTIPADLMLCDVVRADSIVTDHLSRSSVLALHVYSLARVLGKSDIRACPAY